MNKEQVTQHPTFLTVAQFVKKHEWAKTGGVRQLIFHGVSNGFDNCVRRVGKKVLLDEDKVFAWIEDQNSSEG